MEPYTFALVVDGIDVSDEAHVEALSTNDQVLAVSSIDDLVAVDVAVGARAADAAIRAGVRLVELAVKGAVVRRVDLDLVAATDIAARVGVSRQAVSQWVGGGREGTLLPAAVGHVAGGTRVWSWSAVVPWLHQHGYAIDERPLDHDAIVTANALLLLPRRRGRLAAALAA